MNENNWNALGVIRLQHGQTSGAIVAIHPDRFHQPKEAAGAGNKRVEP